MRSCHGEINVTTHISDAGDLVQADTLEVLAMQEAAPEPDVGLCRNIESKYLAKCICPFLFRGKRRD
jgi:hypothetical protein